MNNPALDPNLLASRVLPQSNLFFFFWKAFELLHPGESFVPSWHVMAICHALTEVAEGRTRACFLPCHPGTVSRSPHRFAYRHGYWAKTPASRSSAPAMLATLR